MEIVDNIGRIGVFMIVARTVIHFAAGEQYEKYMKAITGVIVILLFLAPFSDSGEDVREYWQEQAEELERRMQEQDDQTGRLSYGLYPAEAAAMERIEEEIGARLNDAVSDSEYRVADVEIELEEAASEAGSPAVRKWEFAHVRVTVERAETYGAAQPAGELPVRVDRITVGEGTERGGHETDGADEEQSAGLQECRRIFAQTLGVAADEVEVICRGDR